MPKPRDETQFGTLSQLRAVLPRPAALAASAPSPIPAGPFALTTEEKELFNLWVLLGAQYE